LPGVPFGAAEWCMWHACCMLHYARCPCRVHACCMRRRQQVQCLSQDERFFLSEKAIVMLAQRKREKWMEKVSSACVASDAYDA